MIHLSKMLYHIFFYSIHHCPLPSYILVLLKVVLKIQFSVLYCLTVEVLVFHTTSTNQILQCSSPIGYKDYNQPHFCLYYSASAKCKLENSYQPDIVCLTPLFFSYWFSPATPKSDTLTLPNGPDLFTPEMPRHGHKMLRLWWIF